MNDYLMDSDGDLLIENGDLVRGESSQLHQRNLLLAEKGAYKQFPLVGVGLGSFLLDDDTAAMLREIRLQFMQDGMTVTKLGYSGGKLTLEAGYGS